MEVARGKIEIGQAVRVGSWAEAERQREAVLPWLPGLPGKPERLMLSLSVSNRPRECGVGIFSTVEPAGVGRRAAARLDGPLAQCPRCVSAFQTPNCTPRGVA